MGRKRKKRGEKYDILKPITLQEADDLACGKMIYQLGVVHDMEGNILGKGLIFRENFYETGTPEEKAKTWSLHMLDDGRLLINEW